MRVLEIDDADARMPSRSGSHSKFGEWKSRSTQPVGSATSRSITAPQAATNSARTSRWDRRRRAAPANTSRAAARSRCRARRDRRREGMCAAVRERHGSGGAERCSADERHRPRRATAAPARRPCATSMPKTRSPRSSMQQQAVIEILCARLAGALKPAVVAARRPPPRTRARPRRDARCGCKACRRGSVGRPAAAANPSGSAGLSRPRPRYRRTWLDDRVPSCRRITLQIADVGALGREAVGEQEGVNFDEPVET